jgi:pimeloyl-ACP methyl ester carboxylesterase
MHLDKILNDYNVLSIDLPGHGYTTGPIHKDVESHSLFCIELIKKLELDQIIFIGHSWGGLIALNLSIRYQNIMTICMNTGYPFLVGDMLLDHAKGNLDQAVEFLTKYGVYKMPEVEIKSQGFGVRGSGFYGRSKGQIKSPYGTKVVEADPDREIKLYPLKRLFNQTQKEISSIDLKSCTSFRMDEKNIQVLNNIKYIFSDKDRLAKYNEKNPLLQGLIIDKDIHILKETGHFPFFEDPAQLETVLMKILSNN